MSAKELLADDEAAWEEAVVTEALGDALRLDGKIDFAKLNARMITVDLKAFYPNGEICSACSE